MFLTTVRGGGGVLARLTGARDLPVIVPTDALRHSMARERYRADRSRRPLSLALFDTSRATPQEVRRLARQLDGRRRLTDDLGWMDTRRIAALLPDTPSSGAHRFAEDVLEGMGADGLRFPVEILTHPWGDGGDQGRGPLDRETAPPKAPPVADPDSTVRDAAPAAGSAAVALRSPVQSLSAQFILNQPTWKRTMDILGASALLVLLSPLLLLAAIAIRIDSPGGVFFHQRRAGRGGRPFRFHKFRSMYEDAEERKSALDPLNEADGPVFKMRDDPRITRVGRLLRRTSIDELPQLWNVLMGEMSLVGPRPPTLEEVPNYEPWQARRLELLGGLTCIWQVSGRSEIGFDDWMRMDLQYVRQRSFLTDIALLGRTIGAVLTRRGAY